jgi:glycosyltransferase involved in cell wall biosynthesis
MEGITKKLRIAIFEPSRLVPGGGRGVMPAIAKHLSEQNEVTIFTQQLLNEDFDYGNSKIVLIKPGNTYLANLVFYLCKLNKNDFDLIIYGCYPAGFASFRNKGIPSLHITHAPPRFFYDLKEYIIKNSKFMDKIKLYVKNLLYKKTDYKAAQNYTKILGISKEIKNRIKTFYKRDSEIFYPGIYPEKYKIGRYGDYILCATRFSFNKRTDKVIEAMKLVKNKKIRLVITGSGPLEKEIREQTKKLANVEILGYVSEKKLSELYSNCLATIYVPINEDYGYAPVEAAASGKATIGVNEGGLKETIINNKTGFLINDVTPQKIADKIDFLAENRNIAIGMGKNAKTHSKKFYWSEAFKIIDKSILEILKKGEIK